MGRDRDDLMLGEGMSAGRGIGLEDARRLGLGLTGLAG